MNNPFDMLHPTVMIRNAGFRGRNMINRNTIINGYGQMAKIGYGTTVGGDCIITGDIEIGNYCQFGWRISIRSGDHPLDKATVFSNSRLLNGVVGSGREGKISIGNDVWIGDSAIILKGVKIGNGVAIGAGAVVVKDVPDYSVVVGNPSRIIRKRFDSEIIALFNQLGWWDFTFEQIESLVETHELFTFSIMEDRERAVQVLTRCIMLKKHLFALGNLFTTPLMVVESFG